MKILITGAAGFIGSHTAEALLARGHTVVVVDNLLSGSRESLPRGVRWYRVDYSDTSAMERIFRTEKPEGVFHLAARISVRESILKPALYVRTDVMGSVDFIDMAKRYGVKKFIFSSTGGALYGNVKILPVAETRLPQPSSPYAMSKLFIEQYLFASGIPAVALRYANVYGPRQNPHGEAGIIAVFCEKMCKGERPAIYNAGDKTRDYIHVTDVAAANVMALENDNIFGVYHIGTGKETDANGIFALVKKEFDFSGEPTYMEMPDTIERNALSSEKFQSVSGWRPEVSLEDGIAQTALWFKQTQKDTPQKIRMRFPRFLYRLASFI